ncbi:MAG: hypothetical protein LBU32_16745 [Clostridiales bacterium]|nr:hypothetical protein [Clostridiales bacterium]
MAVIGIMGEKSSEAKEILEELIEGIGQTYIHKVIDIDRKKEQSLALDVLVAVERSSAALEYISGVGDKSIFIMNPDHKDILKCAPGNHGLVITYGFNSKVCVTASSVMDNEMQICIQRDLPTLSGKQLEQQEFAVFVNTEDRSPEHLLAAVTALLACDGANVRNLQVLKI